METERLTTLDEYGGRRFVIPAEVSGPLRTWRTRVFFVLIFVFLALPWVTIDGIPLLMFDVPGRRFAIFGKMFYAHDSPLLFFILTAATMALAAATAWFGRVWCGWACPQTVFIDAVYRRIEIWIEGNYIERRRLRQGGMTPRRFWKASLKWFLYFIVSSLIAHSFMALFTGGDELIAMIKGPPGENWAYFVIITFLTLLFMFNFGWFREQFCTIMCPYGRFQSVMMDADSVTVLYDEKRDSDCVKCNRCVEVCPAKIDIRHGVQMECIACTACIDACNIIMRKVHKPEHLILYQSVNGKGVRWLHPRALIYSAVGILCLAAFAWKWAGHQPFEATVLRAKDTPYQKMADDLILNHFKIHLFNQSTKIQRFAITLDATSQAAGAKLTQAAQFVELRPGKNVESHVFVTFPASLLDSTGRGRLELEVREDDAGPVKREIVTVGPERGG